MKIHPSEFIELEDPKSSPVTVIFGNKTVSEGSKMVWETRALPLLTIPETLTVGYPIMRLLAVDKDNGLNGSITYGLESETYIPESTITAPFATHHFTVHLTTSALTVSGLLPPQTEFRVNITATDGGGLQTSIIARVFVKDVNNNPPVFDKSRYYFDMIEGDYSGKLLGHVHATDPDFGENANVSYTMLQKRDSLSKLPFIVSYDGVITVDGKLDQESQSSYLFRIMAQDHGPTNRRLRSTVDVEVRVLDLNDNAPVFYGYEKLVKTRATGVSKTSPTKFTISDSVSLPLYVASVIENSPPGTRVIRVMANDSDSTVNGNGMLLFHIQYEDNHPQLFAIDSKDGLVTTTTTLDYEKQRVHNISVVASDLGHPSLSSTALLMVSVLDVPEEVAVDIPAPIFTHKYYELEVSTVLLLFDVVLE